MSIVMSPSFPPVSSASASPSPMRPQGPSKASLNFICSPSSDVPSPRFSRPSSAGRSAPRRQSLFEQLPRNVLATIAFHLVINDQNPAYHPSRILPLLVTSRAVHEAINFENNPELHNSLFRATFDTAALDRRYEWMRIHISSVATRGSKISDLFADPRSWAIEYKTRWALTWRMRQVVKHDRLEIPGVCRWDQVEADLWNVWFLLTENDGRNVHFLKDQCSFQQWTKVYYREDMLKKSLVPGYPPETGAKALASWCALLSGIDTTAESTAQQVDEKIFVTRPFVFAHSKYDYTYAPVNLRKLPTCDPDCAAHKPDPSLRGKALPYERFGYTWRRAPPSLILGMYLAFLRLLERQPDRMGLKFGSSMFVPLPGTEHLPNQGLFSVTRILPSIYHDREWQRNTVCQDPHTSPGLPPLTFRGEVEGFWRAKYLFYDFELYRQILAGNMRGVYTGSFAEQVVEMDLEETVIKVRKDDVGGKGPLLSAGFDEEGEEGDFEEEQRRIQEGYGNQVCHDDNEPDEPGWTKEILISGRAQSSWGPAYIRGRIRSWDGLVILIMSYKAQRTAIARWLWRGYIHTGGHFVGRWRDTFTPEHLRGYEGAVGMIRAGDIVYPPHFPRTMAESRGIVQHTGRGGEQIDALSTPAPGTYTPYTQSELMSIVAEAKSRKREIGRRGSGESGASAVSAQSGSVNSRLNLAPKPESTSSTASSPGRDPTRIGPTWNTGPSSGNGNGRGRKRVREE